MKTRTRWDNKTTATNVTMTTYPTRTEDISANSVTATIQLQTFFLPFFEQTEPLCQVEISCSAQTALPESITLAAASMFRSLCFVLLTLLSLCLPSSHCHSHNSPTPPKWPKSFRTNMTTALPKSNITIKTRLFVSHTRDRWREDNYIPFEDEWMSIIFGCNMVSTVRCEEVDGWMIRESHRCMLFEGWYYITHKTTEWIGEEGCSCFVLETGVGATMCVSPQPGVGATMCVSLWECVPYLCYVCRCNICHIVPYMYVCCAEMCEWCVMLG